ncbi:hypothetical protein DEU35_1447 [Microbacterium sp. AG157]|uniref:hypothetical protein n=1 Tax=Microbacterium sp. AG157 TaxID=2183993 RepID=UPI000E247C69|nr:hypothetical protein [Microbacterium sp. AG157]REC98347.1 hypothetical protein DEU35_1447 [Microbacterium sp. AG157]
MKAFLTRVAGWFTDARRQALQALVASATSLLVILGAVTDVQSSALLDLSASGLLALQGALGLFLLRPGDRFTWLNTTGRGVIYSLGGAIGVVGFTFSLWSESTSSLILQVATVLASILVGALQMVNAATLSAPPVGDLSAESADAASPVEASPTAIANERPGLRVAVFWPSLPNVDRHKVLTGAYAAFPAAETVYVLTSAVEFRGLPLDVVLVTVPLTRALVEVFEPNVAASSFDGQRVQHLEVA